MHENWGLAFFDWQCVCFYMCRRFFHIYLIISAPTGDPRPLQSCPPSCFVSACSYMGIFLPSFLLLCCTVYFLNNNPTPPFEFPSHPTIIYCTRKHARTLLLMPVSNGLRQEWPAPLQEVVCSPVLMPGSTYFVLCFAKFFFLSCRTFHASSCFLENVFEVYGKWMRSIAFLFHLDFLLHWSRVPRNCSETEI